MNVSYKKRLNFLKKILYGLIGFHDIENYYLPKDLFIKLN